MSNQLEYMSPDYNDLIELAKYIAQFKSQAMELAFAELLRKHLNPPCRLKED